MAIINKIDTTFSNKDIHTPISVYEYTANGTYKVRFQIQLTGLVGGADYKLWLTLNDGDVIGDNIIGPSTKETLLIGSQSRWYVTADVDVMNGDVINIFAEGAAGDTSISGIIRVFSDDTTAIFEEIGEGGPVTITYRDGDGTHQIVR